MVKKLLLLVFAVQLVLASFIVGNFQVKAEEEPKIVRVGIYDNPPKIFTDEKGNVTGIFGDILAIIALKENWELEFVPGTFQEGLDNLESGNIDIMVDVAIDDDRKKLFEFNNKNVLSSWGTVYVRDNSDIDSMEDLSGKTVGILQSSIYLDGPAGMYKYASTFDLKIDLVEFQEYDQVFEQLSEGKIDAAVVSRISGLTAEGKYKNIQPTNIIFRPTELHFALRKNNPENQYLIEKLDYWVTELKNGYGGLYRIILEEHNLLGLTPKIKVTPAWVLPFTLFANVAILISWTITIIFAIKYYKLLSSVRNLKR